MILIDCGDTTLKFRKRPRACVDCEYCNNAGYPWCRHPEVTDIEYDYVSGKESFIKNTPCREARMSGPCGIEAVLFKRRPF